MKGYVTIPKSIYCNPCKRCGERPILLLVNDGEYVVKCPGNDNHYQTQPGLIDIEDWNIHNTVLYENIDFLPYIGEANKHG